MTEYIVTGIPRSGTSLVLSLLESNKNVLCFSEPPWIKSIRDASDSGTQLIKSLKQKLVSLRNDIAQGNSIEMVYQEGRNNSPDNYFKRESGTIKKNRKNHRVILDKHHSKSCFVIKANAIFTATLDDFIRDNWHIVPVVRDPLFVLMSWNTVPIASSKGKVKVVEKFSKTLKEIGQQTPLIKRQVLLLDWYFKQYERFGKEHVLYYEDLIKNPDYEINKFFPNKQSKINILTSKNTNNRYTNEPVDFYKKALKKYGNSLNNFYSGYN